MASCVMIVSGREAMIVVLQNKLELASNLRNRDCEIAVKQVSCEEHLFRLFLLGNGLHFHPLLR